jgi:hypothetical protein
LGPAVIGGILLNIGGGLQILINAFPEDVMCGFLYLLIPFYALYFLVSRWDENAAPFFVSLMGVLTFITAIMCGALVF